jgi:mutator protein MutT
MTTPVRHAAACAVIFDSRGRILLQQRSDNGRWSLPGGAIEHGETAAAAVVREVEEETGLTVEVVRLFGVYSDPAHTTVRYPDGNTVSYIALAFECRVVAGELCTSDESMAVAWCDPRNLPQPLNDKHLPRISDAQARQTAAFFR